MRMKIKISGISLLIYGLKRKGEKKRKEIRKGAKHYTRPHKPQINLGGMPVLDTL